MAVSKERILKMPIEQEIKTSYLDYAMSVIVGRALPDVRDGLKPVHRRILFTMYDSGNTPDRPHRKCARVVGDVIGKYHPHGDIAVYDALVRMAQDFSMRAPLVDGHGNFGSVDGDPPAAYRYTESRLSRMAMEMLTDIEKDTVNFIPNYDGSLQEPVVLPSKLPQLLLNGSSGIAVGMATNIPSHNLGELVDGLVILIDDEDATVSDLMKVISGPDFPTGAFIRGKEGIRDAYTTGRGSLVLRARYEKEELEGGRSRILITELPYQVNKASLISNIAELVREKKVSGITGLRDESDRRGMCVVIELSRGTNPDVILKYLCKHTQIQISFGIIMLALVNGVPQVLSLKDMLQHYLNHRREVVTRRTKFDLNRAQERAHILEGYKIALSNLDAIITTIRQSENPETARTALMKKFKLSEKQAQAILDLRLQRLTQLERKKIDEEYKEIIKTIAYLEDLLKHPRKIMQVIKTELLEMKEKHGDARRTVITEQTGEIDIEDTIPEEDIVITLTHGGFIKRTSLGAYRSQKRGGMGVMAATVREEDYVRHLLSCTTKHYVLFFTNRGIVFRLKAHEIPQAGRQAKGHALINLIQIQPEERVTAVIEVKEFDDKRFLFMATEQGTVKKTPLSEFENLPRVGKIALTLEKGDQLCWVKLTDGKQEIMMVTSRGQSIQFTEAQVRPMGRQAKGVAGIRLGKDDRVVGMETAEKDLDMLVVTELGYGKRTPVTQFRKQSRGGKGTKACKITKKNGSVVAARTVEQDEEMMLVSSEGVIIRTKVKEISRQGRATQGVRIMKLPAKDKVVAVEKIAKEDE